MIRAVCLLIFLAFSSIAFGQFNSMPITVRTPYGNVTHHVPTGPPMHTMYRYHPQASVKHRYKIILQNDSVIEARTAINISDSIHYLPIKEHRSKREIRPAETKSLEMTAGDGTVRKGIPADTCWLFRIGFGAIMTYAYVPELLPEFAVAIQDGALAPIVPLTRENLLALVPAGNEKITKLIEKGKLHKAVAALNKL